MLNNPYSLVSDPELTFPVGPGGKPAGDPFKTHLTFSGKKQAAVISLSERREQLPPDQVQTTHTKIPNALIENLSTFHLPGEQLRVLLVIIRKTFGWHKEQDWISLSQFERLTGIAKRNVIRALHGLKGKQIINSIPQENQKTAYRVNLNFQEWETGPGKGVSDQRTGDFKTSSEGVSDQRKGGCLTRHPQKKVLQKKENNTTQDPVCDSFSEIKTKLPKAPPGKLSDQQMEYISLEVDRAVRNNEIKKTPAAYRAYLNRQALNGNLETDNLDRLREEKNAWQCQAWVKTLPDMDPEDRQAIFKQAAEKGQVEISGNAFPLGLVLEGLKKVDARCCLDLETRIKNLQRHLDGDAQRAYLESVRQWAPERARAFIDEHHLYSCEYLVNHTGRQVMIHSDKILEQLRLSFPSGFEGGESVRPVYQAKKGGGVCQRK